MTKEVLIALLGVFVLLFSLTYCDSVSAQEKIKPKTIQRAVNCYEMTTEFQKQIYDTYYIKAAGVGLSSEGKELPSELKIVPMVMIAKDGSDMIMAEMIDSSYMCILSFSRDPKYVNANSNQGREEEIENN